MKCPYCHEELGECTCQDCKRTIPKGSKYCMYCGAGVDGCEMEDSATDNNDELIEDDFDERVPCSDGNCIGIIINGKCNICGKPYKGKA